MKRFSAPTLTALVCLFALRCVAGAATDTASAPAGIPAGYVKLSPCIAAMGEHWGDPHTLPTGPIYGVYDGKPVFVEIMIGVDQLQKGFSYDNLRPLPGYAIDHVDFQYEPHGHAGFPFPHYDLHAYFISAAEQKRICPNGIADPAMPMNHRT
jgi:hypothetical protein